MPRTKKPVADKPKPLFDLGLLPGTKGDQKAAAHKMLGRGEKPIAVEKAPGGYAVKVIGTVIGVVPTKEVACNAASTVGMYRLELGDFVSTYVDGWCKR